MNFEQIRRTSVSGNLNRPRVSLNGGWSRSVRLAEDPAERTVGAHSLRGNATLRARAEAPDRGGLGRLRPRERHCCGRCAARLRYSVQCCGFLVEHIRYNWNGRDETQWRFNLELANIGSIGNFLGVGADGGRQGLAGYR